MAAPLPAGDMLLLLYLVASVLIPLVVYEVVVRDRPDAMVPLVLFATVLLTYVVEGRIVFAVTLQW